MSASIINRKSSLKVEDKIFVWAGRDRNQAKQSGEIRAATEAIAEAALRRQGIMVESLKQRRVSMRKRIAPKDIMMFSRQLATMLKSGIPLVQSLDIVANGHPNPAMGKLLANVRSDVEQGTSPSAAFRKYPKYFSNLFCDLFEAGENSGALETILFRISEYQEKSYAIVKRIKGALTYPIAVMIVAAVVVTIIMIFVVPVFTKVFASFHATLPAPTRAVISISKFFVHYWWILAAMVGGGAYAFRQALVRSKEFRATVDRLMLHLPIFGGLIEKGALARWARTLATMFSAGVPMVEALDAVASVSGNVVFRSATLKIQNEVRTGTRLRVAMQETGVFPKMFLQMADIGEESGAIDTMMTKIAEFYEQEVDEIAKNLSSLMEPLIISILGVVIGGLVVALYMPIFNLGAVVH